MAPRTEVGWRHQKRHCASWHSTLTKLTRTPRLLRLPWLVSWIIMLTPTHLQPPVKSSAPPSHELSDWLFLCLFRFLPNGNRSGTISPRRERSSVRALFRTFPNFCRRLALKTIPFGVACSLTLHPYTLPQSRFLRSNRSAAWCVRIMGVCKHQPT